ncbi:MAG TPA: amidohydrolase family protein [Longimicrobiales bacterium]|nr:amidohydrolase family protein [Longimicrobiales bacterium]
MNIDIRGMRNGLMGMAVAGALVLGSAVEAAAQVRMTSPPQSQPIAITGATIHTVANGTIENGTIVFEGGVITAVGADVQVPAGAQVVDGAGKHIYPGLIDAYSQVGISEIGSVDVSSDVNEIGNFNPNVRAELAVNAESRHIGTTRSAGVLVTLTTPGGGLVSGMSSAMNMEGWTWEDMSLKSEAALNVSWPNPNAGRFRGFGGNNANRPTYAEQVQELKAFFADARAYRDAKASGERILTDSRYESMIKVLDREIPVIVAADGISEINDAITWAQEEDIDLVIRGGGDAIYVADRLVANDIPVILTETMDAPGRSYEGYDGAYARAAELHEAGVTFAISGGSSAAYSNRLPWEAGVAIAFGLPEDEAIRAVTQNAANIMGIGDRVGTLEPGKDATLLVTTGNPLDMMNDIEQMYIQGRELDQMDIHRWFFEKYMAKIAQMRVVM